jgi:hypothetical protein
MFMIGFPLLLVPVVLYNMVVFLLDVDLNTALFSVPLLSGRAMAISIGDVLVLLGIVLLYVEILKASRLSTRLVMDHVLSLVLLAAMIAELAAVPRAATSAFLILTAFGFFDVVSGFTIRNRARQAMMEDR